MFFFPEGGIGFQPVDQKGASVECFGAMASRCGNDHDLLSHRDLTDTVNQDAAKQ